MIPMKIKIRLWVAVTRELAQWIRTLKQSGGLDFGSKLCMKELKLNQHRCVLEEDALSAWSMNWTSVPDVHVFKPNLNNVESLRLEQEDKVCLKGSISLLQLKWNLCVSHLLRFSSYIKMCFSWQTFSFVSKGIMVY